MQSLFSNIVWTDGDGKHHSVPISETTYAGGVASNGFEDNTLPRIDLYSYRTDDKTTGDVCAWAETEQQLFEIIEQIMLLFNPHVPHDHKFKLIERERMAGIVLGFHCIIRED